MDNLAQNIFELGCKINQVKAEALKMYEMQLQFENEDGTKEWKSIKASHLKEPYRYKTIDEAMDSLNMCYPLPLESNRKRIVEAGTGAVVDYQAHIKEQSDNVLKETFGDEIVEKAEKNKKDFNDRLASGMESRTRRLNRR